MDDLGEGMQDELAAAMLHGDDPGLIFEAGSTERCELALLPLLGVFVDRRIIFVERALVLDERLRYPLLREVDDVAEDEVGYFAGGRSWEVDREADL